MVNAGNNFDATEIFQSEFPQPALQFQGLQLFYHQYFFKYGFKFLNPKRKRKFINL